MPFQKFMIHGLPRSGTAWWANLLTWGPYFCAHELLIRHDAKDLFRHVPASISHFGCAETASSFVLDDIHAAHPECKHVIIASSAEDSYSRLAHAGLPLPSVEFLEKMRLKLVTMKTAFVIPRDFRMETVCRVLNFLEMEIPAAVIYERCQMRVISIQFLGRPDPLLGHGHTPS